MSDLNFEFASTGGGDTTGINDPVTTTFKAGAYSLARESIQNVIDAKLPNSSPAIAEFSLFQKQTSQIPGIERLKEVFVGCRNFCKENNDKDAVAFFDAIILKVENNRFVGVLKISDYNTVGLYGDDYDVKGNYFSLMKAVGSSSKSGTTGGSFGLGKGA